MRITNVGGLKLAVADGACCHAAGTHDADVQQQESISAATWKAGAVGISSVVGFVLVIKLAVLFMQRRRLKQPSHTKVNPFSPIPTPVPCLCLPNSYHSLSMDTEFQAEVCLRPRGPCCCNG